nr:vegetative cell wall protein gp1-like [Aegilops tauschii subsp. strangulata]
MAGSYAPLSAGPIAAYGHPALPWPSQGAHAYSGQPLLPFQAGAPALPWPTPGAPACTGLPLLPFQAGHPGRTSPAAAPLWYLQPPSPAATDAPAHPPQPTLEPPAPSLPSPVASSPAGLPIHQHVEDSRLKFTK